MRETSVIGGGRCPAKSDVLSKKGKPTEYLSRWRLVASCSRLAVIDPASVATDAAGASR
jgi:hypothetical protein